MGQLTTPGKVKLVIPVLFSDKARYAEARRSLERAYGPVDLESEPFEFTFTPYYDDEMGKPIWRTFLSFRDLIAPEALVRIKRSTNRVEEKLSAAGKRLVNLDPGYLELGKFVLATTKDQQHRLYIGKGIYEEITLFYRDKGWRDWEWTYPDYRSERYKKILTAIRDIYKGQVGKGH